MKKIELQIPFEKKDDFKKTCQEEKIKYFWDGQKKTWGIEIPENQPVPSSLRNLEQSKKKVHVIDCDYTYLPFATQAGARWDKINKAVVYEGDTLPDTLTGFHPKLLSHAWRIERSLNNLPPITLEPNRIITLHPHQETASGLISQAWTRRQPGFLLADETGLGKTITTWNAILTIAKMEARPLKILVTGPLNSLETWRETILWMGTGGRNEIILLNYEKIKKLFTEKENRAKSLKGLAKFGETEKFDIFIVDESHYLKSPSSARSKLAKKVEENSRFTLWISATAGQNPLELSYLSSLLSFKTEHRKSLVQNDFETWCQSQNIHVQRGKFGKWSWTPSEDDNKKLNSLLFGDQKIAIRRRCQDVAGWPELQRIPKPYTFTKKEKALYDSDWKEFLDALNHDKIARTSGTPTAYGLEKLLRLRQKSSLLRAPFTADLTEEILENGFQVAISVEFLKTLDEIKKALQSKGIDSVEFSGRNTSTREDERKKYQNGLVPVIIFSTESSISLHQEKPSDKPRSQICHDLRWSGIEQEQIDGRSHRNGSHAPTYWCFSKDSVEERVGNILLQKLENMNSLRGDTVSFQDIYKAIQA